MVKAPQRFTFSAKVILQRHNRHVMGKAHNISKSGIFVRVDRKVFNEDEVLRVFIKPHGTKKYYRSIARVVRSTSEPSGYGLQFISP
jgi:hypothetical protein